MHPLSTSKQPLKLSLSFFFDKQLFTLLKKIKTKKIINIFTSLTQLKNALVHHFPLTIFYCSPYFKNFLYILKTEFFIFNYFKISYTFLPLYFKTTLNKTFLENLVCVIFKPVNLFGNLQSLTDIIFISTPSRLVFISYAQLTKLVNLNQNTIYILNTTFGLMTHKNALKKKIGGSLLCKLV